MRILIRATNWLGDAVMSLPAIRAVRENYRSSEITLLAKRSVADIYARESAVDKVIIYAADRWRTAKALAERKFHMGILFPNSFDSALVLRLARIPQIVGYDTDMRRLLLSHPVPTPEWKGSVHERFYYLEMLQEARLIDGYHHADVPIRLDHASEAAADGRLAFAERGIAMPVIGVSPGAAYGSAKCWIPARFAESAAALAAPRGATVALFGSSGDATACNDVADALKRYSVPVINLAGQTTLRQFIDMVASCSLFLTNDSGAMHVASAAGVPTVAIFGATSPKTTGPAGPYNAVIQEKVECGPCFKRVCPIDHHC
ncbi:MAG TPA: lipopolysaccharide heptosyltransferase II, partial [Bryobacteraceae bacterium]